MDTAFRRQELDGSYFMLFTVKKIFVPTPAGRWLSASTLLLAAAFLVFIKIHPLHKPEEVPGRLTYNNPAFGTMMESIWVIALAAGLSIWAYRIIVMEKYRSYFKG